MSPRKKRKTKKEPQHCIQLDNDDTIQVILDDCLLWTEKYKPNNSSQFVGHKNQYLKLKSWLENWNNLHGNVADVDDSNYRSDETTSCILIHGPPGSGKTCMVYSVAQECSFQVFELNGSMQRNGKTVLKQVREATQSNSLKCAATQINHWFTHNHNHNHNHNHQIQNNVSTVKQATRSFIKFKGKNKKPQNNGILKYFGKNKKVNEEQISNDLVCAKSKQVEVIDVETPVPSTLSFSSNSLILFDDVDILLEDDANGFWNAVKSINEITKKPVVLTATQFISNIFENVERRLEMISLNQPNQSEISNFVKTIHDNENDDNDKMNLKVCENLLNCYDFDIRRSINELNLNAKKWKEKDEENLEKKHFITSNKCYNSFFCSDLLRTYFHLRDDKQLRRFWLNNKCHLDENQCYNSLSLAEEINNQICCLTKKLYNFQETYDDSTNSSIIDAIESVGNCLDNNINTKSLVIDYLPYLSMICHSEAIRYSLVDHGSRRTRRFMHHFDNIGFYVDNHTRDKLVHFHEANFNE